jgi:hypothetical protein
MHARNVEYTNVETREGWFLAQRPWTKAERLVVWRGFLGRFFIAIEPLLLSLVFTGLVAGLIRMRPHEEALVLAPIFGSAALAFIAYAVALMIAPVRALAHTFSPIYIVDGYVRYRNAHPFDEKALAYVAALDERRRLLGEWPLDDARLLERTLPALIEFSRYGGIHKIDGHATEVLPSDLPPLGIGATAPRIRR